MRNRTHHAWDEDDDEGDEYAFDAQDDTLTSCPRCRRGIYDESETCPHCGEYVTADELHPYRRPIWVIVTALVLLLLTVVSVFYF